MSLLKPLRHPRLWLCLWLLAIATVVALSLGPPPPFPDMPSGTDKLEHGLAYFLLAAGAVQLFRSRGGWMVAGLALVLVGIGVEFAQGAYTSDRMRDPFDAIANTVGVLLGLSTVLTPMRDLLLRLERRVRKPA
nr:VanZ family protein [Pseudoxanthomonas sp.]